ncbi:MAG: DUF421 domain-containing protein [Gemmatimonadaceae bacterium]|nr:DUF421 domain-containing protein [Gemmatimonadaceae bacterium]
MVLRPLLVYFALLLVFRLTGKRTLGQITSFDFLVLLIISEAVSNALLASDHSLTAAVVAAITLLATDTALARLKRGRPRLSRLLEDEPVVLVDDGQLHHDRLHGEHVTLDDILEAARREGLTDLAQVRLAVLERRGTIAIIAQGGTEGAQGRVSP